MVAKFYNMTPIPNCVVFLLIVASLGNVLRCDGKEILTPRPLLTENGDLILSAMFPKTVSQNGNSTVSGQYKCTLFKLGVFLVDAFRYAIKEVNRKNILKGMKLGYDIYDTCSRVDQSVKIALTINDFIEKESRQSSTNKSSDMVNKHIAVIGAGKSELSITVNNILSAVKIPQVSYASTSKLLSDKYRFPTFSRTIPTDTLQAKVIARLFSHFGWTYATLVYSDDNYGRPLASSLISYSDSKGICFADIVKLRGVVTDKELENIVNRMKINNKAKVVVVFLNSINSKRLVEMAQSNKIPRKVWIFTATWYNSKKIFEEHANFLDGSIGVVDEIINVPSFYSYFTTIENTSERLDDRSRERSEIEKNIQATNIYDNNTFEKDIQFRFGGMTLVPYVVNAVFAVVNAINRFCIDTFPKSSIQECQRQIKPSSIVQYFYNTTFKGVNDRQVFLDQNGDPINNNIEVYSFQPNTGNNTQHVRVGCYEGLHDKLSIDISTFKWNGSAAPLTSKCSLPCSKGFYKVVNVMSSCCWQCVPCPSGTFNNESNSGKCRPCSEGSRPNQNQTDCEYISYKFLRWTDPWTIFISVSSVFSSLVAISFFVVFVYFRDTPVVRASDREFSLFLLLSMALGLALPIMYPGRPTNFRCRLQDVLPGVIYTLTLSVTIAKTNRTALIFNIRGASTIQRVFVRRSVQFSLVMVLTSTQLIVSLLWLSSRPPLVKEKSFPDYRFLMCDFNSAVYFLLSKVILFLLSFACIGIALSSRHIPRSYNNARHTLLALMIFKVTWLIEIVGRFYGDSGAIIDSLTMLIAYSFLLYLMFAAKIYILLFRKDLNNARVFRERTWAFTLKKQAASLGSLQFSASVLPVANDDKQHVTMVEILKHDKSVQTDDVVF